MSSARSASGNSLVGISEQGIRYDKEILNGFNLAEDINQTYSIKSMFSKKISEIADQIYVTVDIKDTSGINISSNDSAEEFASKIDERTNILSEISNSVFETLSEDEFILEGFMVSGRGFSGNITEEGFEKLLSDTRVRKIYAKKNFTISLSESVELINADSVWNSGYEGSGQTVCVIDTGVDYTRSDLGGCTEQEFLSGNCDTVIGGYDYVNTDSNPIDDNSHGTFVAGIIISQDLEDTGVSSGANIVALKACDDEGHCDDETAVRNALFWCLSNKDTYNISVVSMSFGGANGWGDCGEDYADTEIEDLYNAGISIVAASGNGEDHDQINYPACNDNVISVGAVYDDNIGSLEDYCTGETILGICYNWCTDDTTEADQMTCFSNRGNLLDLVAPGCNVTSVGYLSGGVAHGCGTSSATPVVSGAIALLKEANPSLISPSEILELLQDTGVDVYDSESDITYKRIDVAAALNATCDADNDGYFSTGCKNGDDCDDSNAGVNPGMDEYFDGVDNDCDGTIDEDCEGSEYEEIDDDDCDFTECSVSGYDSCIDWDCSEENLSDGCDKVYNEGVV